MEAAAFYDVLGWSGAYGTEGVEVVAVGLHNEVRGTLEWLAATYTHVPNRGEQMVRYYGYYSNVALGKQQKESRDNTVPCILEPQGNEKAYRKSWARLIQKIYEVDPLICPKCQCIMRVISAMMTAK